MNCFISREKKKSQKEQKIDFLLIIYLQVFFLKKKVFTNNMS